MKKAMFFTSILALAVSAKASTVNFAALPAATTPTLVPNGYSNLDWSNFYYVDPIWSGAGDGFRQGPSALDVAYLGGGECEKEGASCSASINSSSATAMQGFVAQSAIVAAGYHAETIKVTAYNRGNFVGSQQYDLTTSLQQINFPANWGTVTQLVLDTNTGTLVLYALQVQPIYTPSHSVANKDAAGDDNSVSNVGPTAPVRVIDPLDGVQRPNVNSVQNVGPTAPVRIIDPLDGVQRPPVSAPNANKNPGPTVHYSEGANADGFSAEPPIAAPNASKNVGPISHRSASSGAGSDIVVEGPNAPVTGPKAPKRGGIRADGFEGNNGSTTPDAVLPNAPRNVGPISHRSASSGAGSDIVIEGPNAPVTGPTAPKRGGIQPDGFAANNGSTTSDAVLPTAPRNVGPISHRSVSSVAGSDIVIQGPNIPVTGPTAPKRGGIQADGFASSGAGSDIVIEGPNAPVTGPTAPKRGGIQPE